MSFWESSIGSVTGDESDAFTGQFKHIPDNSMLLAKIKEFNRDDYNGSEFLEIEWQIVGSQFDGQLVRQKIRCWDDNPKKRHKALSMFMYLHKLYKLQPPNDEPQRMDLAKFINKGAGLKIQLTDVNPETGKQYNWVSEVHPTNGFKTEVGEEVKPTVTQHVKAQPFTHKNFPDDPPVFDDSDIPF